MLWSYCHSRNHHTIPQHIEQTSKAMTVTQSESAPLVVIVGATGNQGGSVLRNLVESNKEYRIRALSRDGSKPSSQKIKETGAEIFEVDIRADNKDGIVKAFAGADIVFVSTCSRSPPMVRLLILS